MENLFEKIDNLIAVIEEKDEVKKIKKLNEKIKQDVLLQNLIEEYKKTYDEKIKEKILNNANFREYKELETNLNLLIMYINKRLRSITNKSGCSK